MNPIETPDQQNNPARYRLVCCHDWEIQAPKLEDVFIIYQLHGGTLDVLKFKHCPWCGYGLGQ